MTFPWFALVDGIPSTVTPKLEVLGVVNGKPSPLPGGLRRFRDDGVPISEAEFNRLVEEATEAKRKKEERAVLVYYARIAVIAAPCLLFVQSFFAAFDERHFFTGLLQIFAALTIDTVSSVGSIIAGGVVGYQVASKTKRTWLAWVCGIVCVVLLHICVLWLGHQVPGIGWRLHQMADASYDDF